MKKDLRYFLKTVEERIPELFLRIKKEVSPKWEISSIQKKLEAEGKLPIMFFERIRDHDMRIVTNIFATKRHLSLALETVPEDIPARFAEAQKNRIKPKIVVSGPVKEVVLKDEKADLRILPIMTHCEKDAGPYITSGVTVIRDPVSGYQNAGIYRNRYLSPKKLTMNLAPLSHASEITLQAEERKEDIDAAIVIGHHPTMAMASQERGQLSDFELEMMGGLLHEAVEVVPCETVNVFVPADAEIVIEGKIKTNSWELDGPFGDYWLYYAPPKRARVFEVTAITHRFDAIYHDIFSVGPEHLVLFSLGMEGVVLSQLKQLIPQVKAVHVPVSGSSNLVYIQIKKDIEGLGVNTALAALGAYRFKCAIVVDEDVDIFDDRKVIWAVMTRTQADHSFFFVPGSYISRVDPTGYPPWHSIDMENHLLSTRLGIDATKPLNPSFPEVAEPPKNIWTKVDLREYLK
ncbi:MAG: UbiD family decarboxylase [Thermodesulfobacteriota bacterium]|nr:UbiD family decarboxylase [Thermodesulfobacteriota bacterium]